MAEVLAQGIPVELTGVEAGYGSHRVLHGLDLRVDSGERLMLLGPNGAGKTTFFRCLLGLVRPTAGEIRLFGQNPSSSSRRAELLALVGTSLESPGLPAHARPLEYLEHFARLAGVRHARERARDLLRQWDLPEDVDAQRLSQGQRQRLQVARSLVHAPRLALLDEPAANLDPSAQDDFWQLLESWQAATGATLVVSTHHIEEAFRHGPRWVLLRDGLRIADGRPEVILSAVPGSRRLRLAEPVRGTDLASLCATLDFLVEVRGPLDEQRTEWRVSSSNSPEAQSHLLRRLVEAGLSVVSFGDDGVSMQESYRLALGLPGPGESVGRFLAPASVELGMPPRFAGAALAAARLHGAGLLRERRIALPVLFMVGMLVASALWAIPDGVSSTEILLPLLGLASLLPAGLAGGVAADLVAGERERRSLETLLCAPTSPFAIVVGKALSIFVPALILSWTAIAAVWAALAFRSLQPSVASTLGLALGFAPAANAFTLCAGTWMSARSRTVRSAAQLSALATVPLIALSQAVPVVFPPEWPGALTWPLAGSALALAAVGILWRLRRRLRPDLLLQ